jgi:hypothetical protein
VKRRRSRPIRIKADELLKWGRPKPVGLTRQRFSWIEEGLDEHGYDLIVRDSETLQPPSDAKEFAQTVIFAISLNRSGGVTDNSTYWRCVHALERGKSAGAVYRHGGKTAAMDHVWRERVGLFRQWRRLTDDHDRVRFCGRIPFVGRLSRYDMARDLGANVVRPDWRLSRLSHLEGLSVWEMCHRLARQTGYREATIGVILEAAFIVRLIDPFELWCYGWEEGTPGLELARTRLQIKAKYARSTRDSSWAQSALALD